VPAGAGTIAVISRFTITRDGQTFFDDTFSGEHASPTTPCPPGGRPGHGNELRSLNNQHTIVRKREP